jgi:hypothetical protein
MNTLELRRIDVPYVNPSDNAQTLSHALTDFWIDGRSLAETLGVAARRPWYGYTRFDFNPRAQEQFKLELLGRIVPSNQFDSQRLVLFGCHCGADYCRVISCRLEADERTVRWLEFAEERDGFESPSILEPIDGLPLEWRALTFERAAYERTVLEFARSLSG